MGNSIAKKYKVRFPSYSGSQFLFSYDELKAKFNEYLEYCEEEGQVPMVVAFAVFCGMSTQTLYNYEKRSEEFRKLIDFIREYIEKEKWQGAYKGELDGKIFHLDMINHHRKINSRSVNDNKNDNTGSVKVTEIRRVVVDPKKRDAKAELEALKKAHQEQEAVRGTAEESKQGDVASPRQGSKRTVKTRTKRTKTVKTRKKKGKGQASSEEQ